MDGAIQKAPPPPPRDNSDDLRHHTVGDTIQIRNDGKRGPAPQWVAAIVTDVHEAYEGSLRGDRDKTVFLVAAIYPQVGWSVRGDALYSFSDEGITWRTKG